MLTSTDRPPRTYQAALKDSRWPGNLVTRHRHQHRRWKPLHPRPGNASASGCALSRLIRDELSLACHADHDIDDEEFSFDDGKCEFNEPVDLSEFGTSTAEDMTSKDIQKHCWTRAESPHARPRLLHSTVLRRKSKRKVSMVERERSPLINLTHCTIRLPTAHGIESFICSAINWQEPFCFSEGAMRRWNCTDLPSVTKSFQVSVPVDFVHEIVVRNVATTTPTSPNSM
jgi:hypothetical protein